MKRLITWVGSIGAIIAAGVLLMQYLSSTRQSGHRAATADYLDQNRANIRKAADKAHKKRAEARAHLRKAEKKREALKAKLRRIDEDLPGNSVDDVVARINSM